MMYAQRWQIRIGAAWAIAHYGVQLQSLKRENRWKHYLHYRHAALRLES